MTIHLKGFCLPCPDAVPIIACTSLDDLNCDGVLELQRQGFKAQAGKFCFFHDKGTLKVALGIKDDQDWRSWSDAASHLPSGRYCLEDTPNDAVIRGWGSGSYRYRAKTLTAQLCLADQQAPMLALVRAEYMTRFLIDHPANRLTPARLARRAQGILSKLASERLILTREIIGTELLAQNFPLIYHVGKAAESPPRLLEMKWRSIKSDAPTITIIGKGVCFDTGGLDIKPRAAMLVMKKDMGGAAHAIGLAAMLLSAELNVNIHLILGIAENAIAGNAMHPGDIFTARNGSTVEIGDTDAEGRLVLADCLSYASESYSDLMIDFATLTGAARVALGTDLPALFCNNDSLAAHLTACNHDPIWRLPLHEPYREELSGRISTLNSAPGGGYGGAITAALFLEHFVAKGRAWAHLDLMAYTPKNIHGRRMGAAAQGLYGILEGISSWTPLFTYLSRI